RRSLEAEEIQLEERKVRISLRGTEALKSQSNCSKVRSWFLCMPEAARRRGKRWIARASCSCLRKARTEGSSGRGVSSSQARNSSSERRVFNSELFILVQISWLIIEREEMEFLRSDDRVVLC